MSERVRKVPAAVVVDTRDGYTWARGISGRPFTLAEAESFAAERNDESKPEHRTYEVHALSAATAPPAGELSAPRCHECGAQALTAGTAMMPLPDGSHICDRCRRLQRAPAIVGTVNAGYRIIAAVPTDLAARNFVVCGIAEDGRRDSAVTWRLAVQEDGTLLYWSGDVYSDSASGTARDVAMQDMLTRANLIGAGCNNN